MEETGKKDQSHISLPYYGIPRLIPFFKPYKKTLFAMMVLGLLSSLIDAAFPLFNRYALDHFVFPKTLQGVVPFIIVYMITVVLFVTIDYLTLIRAWRVEISISRDMKNAAFNHLQTLSFSYFNQNNVGYIHSRIMSDTQRIGEIVSWRFMDVIWHGSYLLFMIVMMLIVDIKLALYIMLLIPVTAVIVFFFQKRLIVLHRLIREINSRITALFNEGITGAKTIKILVAEETMGEGFRKETDLMRRTAVKTGRMHAFFIAGVAFMGSTALSIVLMSGGHMTIEGALKLSSLSVFITYALNIMEPVQFLIETLAQLVQAQVNIERITRLLRTESDVADTPEVIEKYGDTFSPKKENWEDLHGHVTFEDVTFMYPDGDENVLTHFNLDVPEGKNIAIVGETGAGKSTLVNLVCRFFEPTKGRILIDGKDARERSQLWLHSHIGYVLQTPHLFSGTVRDNLRYGKEDATDEEILLALRLVSAEEIVTSMEKGLDTEVGEGGSSLSTGEKQLLSFARALIADPKILVLDEATSSVDTVTERRIQEAIRTVIKGRTSFVIAHRLSTVVDADEILVVRDGKIIERGKHSELMRMRGYYHTLYTRQYEELAVKEAFQ
ncbi:MAG: ABC transporter ATP-binding protein [Lachnospiraceae bacterium]|nr:ABC transporter ATP-binding protein [Lachnospiraceae bacterium]